MYSLGIKPNLNETIANGDYLNFKNILEFDKKRKTNKTLGIITTSFSVFTTTYGIFLISNSKNDREGLGKSIGSMFIAAGVLELGVSIPLFVSSQKKKKERDALLKHY